MSWMIAGPRKFSVLTAVMLFLLLAGVDSTAAQSTQLQRQRGSGHWVHAGGPQTGALELLIDPTDPQVAYATTGASYILKSLDGGRIWTPMHQGLIADNVTTLAMDPTDHLVLYAGASRNGVFKSTDGAASWARVSIGLPDDAAIFSIAIDPTDPLKIYAGSSGADSMFMSTDGAESWTLSDTGLASDDIVRSIAIDPADPSTVYAGTEQIFSVGGGAYKSTDAGATWVLASSSELAAVHVYALAIDPGRTDTIYAAASDPTNRRNGGVFKTTDGAVSWTRVKKDRSAYALAMDPRHPRILFAGTETGMAITTDRGAHWRNASEGITDVPVQAVAINPSISQVALAGTFGAMFRTTDRGSTWAPLTDTLGESNVGRLAADPVHGDTIYAVSGGVFKTTDAGRTWPEANKGLPGLPVYALATDPTDPQILYSAPDGSGVFKSTDGAATWVPANNGISRTTMYSLALDSSNPQTIYAGAETGVYKTTDGGQTWVHHETGLELAGYIEALVVDPSNPDVVYAGSYFGGCCSQPHSGPPSRSDSCPGMLSCSTGAMEDEDGVFKSIDAGLTWVRSSLGIGDFVATSVTALAIDPSSPQNLYAAVSCSYYEECGETYVYKTTDGAASWSSSLYVYSLDWFSSIVIDPVNPEIVYAGHVDGGVYRSTDAGVTWETINDGFPPALGVNDLVLTSSGVLYAGTYEGVFTFVE